MTTAAANPTMPSSVTSSNDDVTYETAADTIKLLETRLRRLEFTLTGDASSTGDPSRAPQVVAGKGNTAKERLDTLERELKKLCRDVPAVRDILELCKLPFAVVS